MINKKTISGILFLIGAIFIGIAIISQLPLIWAAPYNLTRLSSCQGSSTVEKVMNQGMSIAAEIGEKKISIIAGSCLERTYLWESESCTILQQARKSRWHGSYGIYSPNTSSWKPGSCKTLEHAVTEEGQQHFNSTKEAGMWLESFDRAETVYTNDGLVVSWGLNSSKKEQVLDVEVWQIYINGEKPTQLDGAQDDKIKINNYLQTNKKITVKTSEPKIIDGRLFYGRVIDYMSEQKIDASAVNKFINDCIRKEQVKKNGIYSECVNVSTNNGPLFFVQMDSEGSVVTVGP